jgi:predicted Zn-dependent protease with MMP-like domain
VRDPGRFERISQDAISTLPGEILAALDDADLVVTDIPPDGDREVPLAEFVPRRGPERPRVTLYRRPLEARASGRVELSELVRLAVGREVALTLGLDIDLDDDWD